MSKKTVLAISGSPSAGSKTAKVVDHIIGRLESRSVALHHIQLRDLDPETLMLAKAGDGGVADAVKAVGEADGVIFATPIYKASYSGLLKVFLDVLPQFALAGKAVLPIATGGSLGHLLALDYGLRPVLQSMGARHIIQSLFVTESDMKFGDGGLRLAEQADAMLREAIHHFNHALDRASDDKFLGHPRPVRSAA